MNETGPGEQRGFYIPLSASDGERRQRLLNTLLLATTAIVSIIMAMNVGADVLDIGGAREELVRMYVAGAAMLLGNGLVFLLNRVAPRLARWSFVFLTLVAAIWSDSPQQMAGGRNLITLAVPVVAASILIHPNMSFVIATLGCLTMGIILRSLSMPMPTPSIAVLFLVALITTLLVRALERTWNDWRTTNRNLALLNQASQALSATLDLEQVLVTVLSEVRNLLGAVASSVWLIHSETEELICWQATEPQDEIVRGWRLAPGEGIAGWVARTGESQIVPNVQKDDRYCQGVDQMTGLGIQSIIAVPLRARENVIGVLEMVDANLDRFNCTDLELLEPLAATAAIAIENARLYAEEQQRATALARALTQQQELDRLKDEFLQNISHELRTPLALILGYAELMDSGELGDLTSRQRGPVSIITHRVRALSKMLNDLIAISSSEAQALREEVVDLADLVNAVLANFQATAEQAGLGLKVEIDPDLPPVSGDPDQLSQVIDNLLSNALKFTPSGGHLTVRLWCDGDGRVIVLEVIDTGIGMPTEKLNRIFDRFYQIDGSAKRRYGGVGLGLALVKKIIEAHKGQVSVWSTVDKGSTFRVTLPAMVASEQVPDKRVPESNSAFL